MLKRLTMTTAAVALLGTGAMAAEMPEAIYPFPPQGDVAAVENRLEELGFTDVQKIRHSGNIYETTATWDGRVVDLRIDGKNGEIMTERGQDARALELPPNPTTDQVGNALEARGYTLLGEVSEDGGVYVVDAMRGGEKADLTIDPTTGKFTDAMRHPQVTIPVTAEWDDAYIANQLAREGYRNARVVDRQGNVISVRAEHYGEPVDLDIDTETGVVATQG